MILWIHELIVQSIIRENSEKVQDCTFRCLKSSLIIKQIIMYETLDAMFHIFNTTQMTNPEHTCGYKMSFKLEIISLLLIGNVLSMLDKAKF